MRFLRGRIACLVLVGALVAGLGPAAAGHRSAAPKRVVGNYVIEARPSAAGYWGDIHRGVDRRTGKRVVAKRFRGKRRTYWRRPYRARAEADREFALMQRLEPAAEGRWPHVLERVTVGRQHFVVMEELPLRSLERDDLPALSTGEVAHITAQLVDIIDEAQRVAGVLHTDLAPSNILIDEDFDPRSLRVIDFGVAKEPGPYRGDYRWTAEYAAPELFTRATHARGWIDHRTDQYGAAAVAVYLLTGEPPFEFSGFEGMREAKMKRELAVDIDDPGLRRVLLKALDPDPAGRYESNASFARALRRLAP